MTERTRLSPARRRVLRLGGLWIILGIALVHVALWLAFAPHPPAL